MELSSFLWSKQVEKDNILHKLSHKKVHTDCRLNKISPVLIKQKQEGHRCPKRRVAQAAIRLATAVITFRNKERNVRLPS